MSQAATAITIGDSSSTSCADEVFDAAEVYTILGAHERTKPHAIAAYKKAWSDGLPYAFHWELERAKKVLAELSVDPPDMPPYDPANVEPVPYEDEMRAWIEELRVEKEERARRESEEAAREAKESEDDE